MFCRALDTAIFIYRFFLLMKKLSRSKIVKKLDWIFSTYIRLRDCDSKWIVICPLCWAKIPRKKAQNMHFISRAILKYRYDENNCHAWCMRCNVILNWNYIVYTRRMQNKFWIKKVDEMINDKEICKIRTPELEEMIEHYTTQCKKIADEKNIK